MIPAPVEVSGGHRHDKSRGAESALAAVMVNHRLLDRVERAIGASNAFDRPYGFAVELGQEQDAGVQRTCTSLIGDHHATGAAIALIAAFFGAGQAAGFAQPIQKGLCWMGRDLNGFTIQAERHVYRCGHLDAQPRYQDVKAGGVDAA